MVETEAKVINHYGIHARPASIIVKEALTFENTKITVHSKNGSVDLSEVLNLMTLGIEFGDVVKIVTEGETEDEAAQKMRELFEYNFSFSRDE